MFEDDNKEDDLFLCNERVDDVLRLRLLRGAYMLDILLIEFGFYLLTLTLLLLLLLFAFLLL